MLVLHIYNPDSKFGLKPLIESKVQKANVLEFSIRRHDFINMAINKMLIDVIIVDKPCFSEFDKQIPSELLSSKDITEIVFDISEKENFKRLLESLNSMVSRSAKRNMESRYSERLREFDNSGSDED